MGLSSKGKKIVDVSPTISFCLFQYILSANSWDILIIKDRHRKSNNKCVLCMCLWSPAWNGKRKYFHQAVPEQTRSIKPPVSFCGFNSNKSSCFLQHVALTLFHWTDNKLKTVGFQSGAITAVSQAIIVNYEIVPWFSCCY